MGYYYYLSRRRITPGSVWSLLYVFIFFNRECKLIIHTTHIKYTHTHTHTVLLWCTRLPQRRWWTSEVWSTRVPAKHCRACCKFLFLAICILYAYPTYYTDTRIRTPFSRRAHGVLIVSRDVYGKRSAVFTNFRTHLREHYRDLWLSSYYYYTALFDRSVANHHRRCVRVGLVQERLMNDTP
jgi:hypothetical protein